VDLDYKGLSNTGTWFLGRLQTERDKKRVLDGLEGVGSSAGGRFDRQRIEKILTSLGKRVFLMNNVHEDEPVVFQTRWVMSYLRGPLTRNQIKELMDPVKASRPKPSLEEAPGVGDPSLIKEKSVSPGARRPVLPPGVPQCFVPVRADRPEEATLYYDPMLMGIGKLYYANAKIGVAAEKRVSRLTECSDMVDWDEAREIDVPEEDLEKFPEAQEAFFSELIPAAGKTATYRSWSKDYKDWLYRNQTLTLLKSPSLKMVSRPGEAERDFRIRLQQAAHEKRDQLIERLRQKYASKITTLEQRLLRAEHAVSREKEQAKQQKLQTMISAGATLLASMLGRKKVSQTTLGRAATTAQRAGRIFKESQDIERAEDNLEQIQEQMKELQKRLEEEIEEVRAAMDPLQEELKTVDIRAKKMDIAISLMALTWVPYWQDSLGGLTPAWRQAPPVR
jgi:hypothetical protein